MTGETLVLDIPPKEAAACGGKFYIVGFLSFGANDAFLSLARDAFEGHIVGSDCGP